MDQIIPAIAKAMGAVKKVGKSDRNAHDGYNFASIDAFLELVNPICAEHGLLVHMEEEGIEDFTRKGKFGDNAWMRVRFALTVYHASGQSLPTVHRSVEVLRNGAQAYGSAQSYALKQFLRALLLIATGDADDADHRATDAGTVKAEPRRSAPQRAPEPPHDPQTGEVYSERNPPPTGAPEADTHDPADDGAGTYRAMRDSILDALKITPEFDANGRMKKLPPAEAELFGKAYAASLIAKITTYKREQAMNMFLSVHEKGISALPKELQTDVWEAAYETRDRINGKHLPPRDPIVLGDVQVTDDAGRPI